MTIPSDPSADSSTVFSQACPSRQALELVASKWALLVIPALADGPVRNNELMRKIEGISQKMLTQTLKELVRNGLVLRADHQTCLLYTSPSPRDLSTSRMPSSA